MKRFIAIFCLLAPLRLGALDDSLKGVYRLYDFDAVSISEPAPKGYRPFYISHYGRHGARFITSASEYEVVYQLLHSHELTASGEYLKNRFDALYPYLQGRAGDLSTVGKMQQVRLASRMYHNWPTVFHGAAHVFAESSTVPRCIMSMAMFCDGLRQDSAKLSIEMDVNSSHMGYLDIKPIRRFSADPPFEAGFEVEDFYSRLFCNPDEARASAEPRKFVQSLFYFICHLGSAGIDDISMDDVLSLDEQKFLHNLDNEKFHNNCGGDDNINCAVPLLVNIIDQADEDIASGNNIVRLRFGHDNSLMSLLCLLGIGRWGDSSWDCSEITMAANLQLIFAKNKQGHVIVKIMLNENDLTSWTDWNDLREKLIQLTK